MTSTPESHGETVEAKCTDCDDIHPVGDRRMNGITTVCPACDSPGYTTRCDATPIEKSHAERISDAVRDVDGVGEQTRENIITRYETYYEFEAADADELKTIDGVGDRTARRIIDTQ